MEGKRPWMRVAEYQREHPGVAICYIGDRWEAWRSSPDGETAKIPGVEPQEFLADLLDRLEQLG